MKYQIVLACQNANPSYNSMVHKRLSLNTMFPFPGHVHLVFPRTSWEAWDPPRVSDEYLISREFDPFLASWQCKRRRARKLLGSCSVAGVFLVFVFLPPPPNAEWMEVVIWCYLVFWCVLCEAVPPWVWCKIRSLRLSSWHIIHSTSFWPLLLCSGAQIRWFFDICCLQPLSCWMMKILVGQRSRLICLNFDHFSLRRAQPRGFRWLHQGFITFRSWWLNKSRAVSHPHGHPELILRTAKRGKTFISWYSFVDLLGLRRLNNLWFFQQSAWPRIRWGPLWWPSTQLSWRRSFTTGPFDLSWCFVESVWVNEKTTLNEKLVVYGMFKGTKTSKLIRSTKCTLEIVYFYVCFRHSTI